MIGYLNINSIKNNIEQLTDICKISLVEILCIDGTKLDSILPKAQAHLPHYQFPLSRRDRNSSGGRKIHYIRNGIVFLLKKTESLKTTRKK